MQEKFINSSYRHGFLSALDDAMSGKSVYLPNPLERVSQSFNLQQSRFTLLGSSSGAGKSAFIDYEYVLEPWSYLQNHPDIHYEGLYYSMERKKMLKHAKWVSWMLYRDKGWLISADTILGYNPEAKMNKAVYDIVRSYDEEMSNLLDVIHIHDGRVSCDQMAEAIRAKSLALGTLFVADSFGVTLNGEGSYLATFTSEQFRETRVGREYYVDLNYKGENFTMTKDSKMYFLNNPQTFFYIILDGVGLIEKRKGQSTKQAVDEVTDLLADARDVFGASPIMVSQFNRAIADIHRQKNHGVDLAPQEGDFRDSAGPFQAADLVLGLFDPIRFKAYDDGGYYGDYDVREAMMSPTGIARFRSLHILKNSFGIDGSVYGMKFMGEVGHFSTLPFPNSPELLKIYEQIRSGL